jgi:hypothetical protein
MEEIKELLCVVEKLHAKYPHRDFPLDGRLVGDIGEITVEKNYNITLYPSGTKTYDGFSGKKQIQIKTTFKDSLTFPDGENNVPDYYIGIKLSNDGSFEEIYNGPGKIIWDLLKSHKKPKTGVHSIRITALQRENKNIDIKNKIERRVN